MNYTTLTLGDLLSSHNETIKRNATSILKQLQRGEIKKVEVKDDKWYCIKCNAKKEEYEAMYCDKCWVDENIPTRDRQFKDWPTNGA